MIKIPSKLEIGLRLLSLMKSIYTNSTANIVNGKTLKASPLKPGIRQSVLCFASIQHCTGVSITYNIRRKIKDLERNKLSLFTDTVVYRKSQKTYR